MAETASVEESPADLSAALLSAVRRGEPTERLEAAVESLDPARIEAATNEARKAFWVNLYNAAAQMLLAEDPDRYSSKRRFFGTERVRVAGRRLSLDDVEHSMLRRSRPKWALGYLRNPFAGSFERRLRVDELDPRVHFALNCGAASCPPIEAYAPGTIDADLDAATRSYLDAEVEYRPEAGRAHVPRLFLWFRGDFGGKSGILRLLREHDQVPADARPRLKHRPYDWTMDRGNYRADG